MAAAVPVGDLVNGHVMLEVECLDRIYLNAYVPTLQVGGQVVRFLKGHRGFPIPSPALFGRIGNRFRTAVTDYAAANQIPLIRFDKHDRKIDVMRRHVLAAEREGRPGVVAIGVAQEFQNVFVGAQRPGRGDAAPWFTFHKQDRRVTCYYFYVFDDDFGPGFIKLCAYFPYPGKVWVNGHEWAKRQATKAGIGFTALSNGFAACDDPVGLQAICDRLGPADIEAFFDRWMATIPTPLGRSDRAAGYWWELSMRQVEVSRTLVFDAPRHARSLFEQVVRDNLGLGRPEQVELIFTGKIGGRGRPHAQPAFHRFKTRVVTQGVQVTVNVFWKHSRIKQYLKDGRAWRIETVINSPDDIGVQRRLVNLPQLQAKARAANHRILQVQRAGQGCAIGPTLFERIQLPSAREGQRAGALRFGDSRAMALAGALCLTLFAVTGVTNRSLRALMTGLLGTTYSASQASYDLRRLRLHGLLRKLEHQNRYALTAEGLQFATFYTKLGERVLPALFATDQPNAPPQIRRALATIGNTTTDYLVDAGLAAV